MLLPKVLESLAGRIEVHTLWPFSQAEIEGVAGAIIERLLDGSSPPASARDMPREPHRPNRARWLSRRRWAEDVDRREEWLASYLTAIVQRDLRDLANIERLAEVPAVLASPRVTGADAAEQGRGEQLGQESPEPRLIAT